jgi:glutathione S-transferase
VKTLYWAKGACSFAPHCVLEELGEPYEHKQVDPLAPRPAGYPHPRGHVPVLVDDGFVLTEAAAIMVYVGEKLLPAPGTKERGQVHELCGILSSAVHVAYRQIRRPARFTDEESAFAGIKTHGVGYMTRLLAELDLRIGKGPWAIGEQFTIVDPYVTIMHRWGYTAELDMSKFPQLRAHSERVRARPAVARIIEREGLNPWP